jgi:hypothetical protein
LDREVVKRGSGINPARASTTPVIETWFHIVRNGSELVNGNTPRSWIAAQLDVLNAAFAGAFAFRQAGITDTLDPNWAYLSPYEAATTRLQAKLRQGNWATLNIYVGGAHTS